MLREYLRAVIGGFSICMGGVAYFAAPNSVIGAFVFTIGIFTIYTFGLNLYTGKICEIINNKPNYLLLVAVVLLGNATGTVLTGYMFRATKLIKYAEKAAESVNGKLSQSYLSAFILAILCGFMMYVAVTGYKTIKGDLGRYFALVVPIMVFIFAGFEHSIANFFYISFANLWSIKSLIFSIIVILGNACGGCMIPLMKKILKEDQNNTCH